MSNEGKKFKRVYQIKSAIDGSVLVNNIDPADLQEALDAHGRKRGYNGHLQQMLDFVVSSTEIEVESPQ